MSSPYDYPKIRSAGSEASPTPPFTPTNSDPSISYSSQQTSFSSPQISRAASQGAPLTPQNRHSNPGLPKHLETTYRGDENVAAPQPNISAPQPSTYPSLQSSELTLQSSESANTLVTAQSSEVVSQTNIPTLAPRFNDEAGTQTPRPNEEPPQPDSSTPKRVPKPNLTIQISPVTEPSDGNSSLPGSSPYLSRRHHPTSPLVLHSSSVSDDSPRTSGEMESMGGATHSASMQLYVHSNN